MQPCIVNLPPLRVVVHRSRTRGTAPAWPDAISRPGGVARPLARSRMLRPDYTYHMAQGGAMPTRKPGLARDPRPALRGPDPRKKTLRLDQDLLDRARQALGART